MADVYLVFFFVGLFFTVVSAVMAGVFGGHDADAHADADGVGADADVDVGDVDVGDLDVGDVDVGDMDVGHVDIGDIDAPDAPGEFEMGHDFDHSMVDAGGDGHVEVGVTDSFPGLSPWSPTVLSSFVTTFGGAGYLSLTHTSLGKPGSVVAGAVAGLLIGVVVFYGMNKLFKALQSSSEVSVASLVGRKAEVITPIPEGGVGEISYIAKGTRLNAPARSVDGKPVGRATMVKIVRITGTNYYVKPC